MDRIFVPLRSEAFGWFKSGRKHIELRRYGGQFTAERIRPGRRVELRMGYSGESIWGKVGSVTVGSLEEIMRHVPHKRVIPVAGSIEDAIRISRDFVGSGRRCIAFEVFVD